MSDRELMQQALEALTNCSSEHGHRCNRCDSEVDPNGSIAAVLRARLAEPDDEPVGHVTVRRLSKRFENHADQYVFYPAGQSPYLDNVDECFPVYTRPAARKVQPLTLAQIGSVINASREAEEGPTALVRRLERIHHISGDSHE